MSLVPRSAAALAVLVTLLAAPAAAQAQENAPTVTTVRQTVENRSPYELRLGMSVISEASTLTDAPARRIAPGRSDTAKAETPSPVNGVDILTSYDAYAVQPGPDRYVGSILLRSDSDCTTLFFLRPVCLTYAGDNRGFASANGALGATWANNGHTSNFLSVFTVTARPAAAGPRTPYEDVDVVADGVTQPELSQDAEHDGDNGAPWDTLPSIVNDTGYQLRLVTIWNNEQAEFHATPPGRIEPRATGYSHVGNDTKYHGVAVLYMWDLHDPRSGEWRGTVYTYAATRCGFPVLRIGCVDYDAGAQAWADAENRTRVRVAPNTGEAPRYTRPQFFFSQTSKDTSPDGDPRTDDRARRNREDRDPRKGLGLGDYRVSSTLRFDGLEGRKVTLGQGSPSNCTTNETAGTFEIGSPEQLEIGATIKDGGWCAVQPSHNAWKVTLPDGGSGQVELNDKGWEAPYQLRCLKGWSGPYECNERGLGGSRYEVTIKRR